MSWQGKPVTERESNQMFAYWCDDPTGKTRSMTEVARHFGRGRSSVYRARHEWKWDERLAAIVKKSEVSTDKALVKQKATTREIMEGAFIKLAKAILDPGVQLTNDYTLANLGELIGKLTTLGRVLLEIEGAVKNEAPGGAVDSSTHVYYVNQYGKLPQEQREQAEAEYDAILGTLARAGRIGPAGPQG